MRKALAVLLVAAMVLLPINAFALNDDEAVLGNQRWKVDYNGDLLPITNDTYSIGNASYYPDQIWLGGVAKSSWGSVVSPWEESAGVTSLTSDPTEIFFTHSSNTLTVGGIDVQNEDITLENDEKIENGTNGAIRLTDGTDSFDVVFDGTDVQFETTDGGIIFDLNQADGTVDFMTSNDDDDYIQIYTTTNQPLINFVGSDGKITAASGGIDFDDENLTTTGTLGSGATTVTSLIIGDDTLDVVADDELRFASNDSSSTIEAYGFEANDAILLLTADESDDSGDEWQLVSNQSGNALTIENDASGAMLANLTIAATTGNVTLIGDIVNENADTIKMNTDDTWQFVSNDEDSRVEVLGYEAKEAQLTLKADQGDDVTDGWEIAASTTGTLTIGNDSAVAGTFVDKLTVAGSDGDITTIGDIELADDMDFVVGSDADWKMQYDEGVDNQLLWLTAGTGATATSDPMYEILVGAVPTADQEVFGIGKGTQASNTALFTVDEDGDVVATGDVTVTGSDITLGAAGVKLTGDGDGAITFLGLGDGTDEDLTMNLDDTANTASFSSSTALDTIEFNAMTVNAGALDVSDGNIANVGDIALDTITSDAATVVTINDGLVGLLENLTTSAADPGVAAAGLVNVVSTITTDDTGTAADEVSLADGVAGQMKIFTLKADTEVTGVKVIPTNFANGTSILFEDVGDGCVMVFDGTNWSIVSNVGGTIA